MLRQDKRPITYVEVFGNNNWRETKQSEVQCIETNNTWIMTPLRLGKKRCLVASRSIR